MSLFAIFGIGLIELIIILGVFAIIGAVVIVVIIAAASGGRRK